MIFRKQTIVVLGAILALAWAGSAGAFCIHNNTDKRILVEQRLGGKLIGSMVEYIAPGKRACCNWQNEDCNAQGRRDSTVAFKVSYFSRDLPGDTKTICAEASFRAGGLLFVEGVYPQGRCQEQSGGQADEKQ